MKSFAIKFAASTLVLGSALVSCGFDTVGFIPDSAQAATGDPERQAGRAHENAVRALGSGDVARALQLMEAAVGLSPRDAGYRMLLADIYLKSGRLQSAETTYADVLALHSDNARAALSLALTRIANGRPEGAVGVLDELGGRAAPADLGLAYALAGQPERGIEILLQAARAPSASARVRQNLALAYALAGNWQQARTVAAQDISPADLPARLQQWAALARPDAQAQGVATILGISPVADPGQPQRLALNGGTQAPAPAPVAMAQAPAWTPPVAHSAEAQAAPIQIAEVEPVVIPVPVTPMSADPQEAEATYAQAAQELVTPEASVIRTPVHSAEAPSIRAAAVRTASARRPVGTRGPGRYAVQIGAFSSAANAERAWVQAERRFGLVDEQPLTTTVNAGGRTLHRVSLAGFDSRGAAAALCGRIRARGGACFVREVAGDAAVRWAARYGPNRGA